VLNNSDNIRIAQDVRSSKPHSSCVLTQYIRNWKVCNHYQKISLSIVDTFWLEIGSQLHIPQPVTLIHYLHETEISRMLISFSLEKKGLITKDWCSGHFVTNTWHFKCGVADGI